MTMTMENKSRQKIAEELSLHLANTYTLYLKTQNYHWNVIDPRFAQIHKLFEGQYEELADQCDEIAERIRMLGQRAPGSFKFFLDNTELDEASNDVDGNEMIRQLAKDHETLSTWLRNKIASTQELGDEGTADMYIQHLRAHDKQAWMLLSHHQGRG